MIHILLTILQIIGIILLVILGLILGIILIILFVPIHYELRTGINENQALDMLIMQAPDISDEEKLDFITNLQVNVHITWILKIIKVAASFANKKLSYFVKIFFFTVLSSEPKKEKKKRNSSKSKTKQYEDKDISNTNANNLPSPIEQDVKETIPPIDDNQPVLEKSEKNSYAKTEDIEPEKKKAEKKKSEKQDFSKTIDELKKKWDDISELITNQDNQEFVKMVLLELKKLLWHIRPRKYDCFLYIGMDDPSVTGTIMMGYGIAKGVLGLEHFEIMPNFEKKIVRLSAYMTGRIRLIHIVVIGCKVYFNKTFRKLLGRK